MDDKLKDTSMTPTITTITMTDIHDEADIYAAVHDILSEMSEIGDSSPVMNACFVLDVNLDIGITVTLLHNYIPAPPHVPDTHVILLSDYIDEPNILQMIEKQNPGLIDEITDRVTESLNKRIKRIGMEAEAAYWETA